MLAKAVGPALAQLHWYRGEETQITVYVYVERTRVGRTGKTCMRDGFGTMYGHPDAADYANLRRIDAKARIDAEAS